MTVKTPGPPPKGLHLLPTPRREAPPPGPTPSTRPGGLVQGPERVGFKMGAVRQGWRWAARTGGVARLMRKVRVVGNAGRMYENLSPGRREAARGAKQVRDQGVGVEAPGSDTVARLTRRGDAAAGLPDCRHARLPRIRVIPP